jgi:hypothetical protein
MGFARVSPQAANSIIAATRAHGGEGIAREWPVFVSGDGWKRQ